MDSLTQIVLGGAIGELVAGRQMGNRAVLWGAIAGTIPDLDVFFRVFYHPIEAALVHRGFSHSLLFSLLVSPILAYLLNIATKRTYGFWLWVQLFFWGIVTHPILDMFTNYGTQFLWPFEARITFNSVFVIDPLYTVPFMVLLIWAMRLPKQSEKRRTLNRIGLVYSTSYLLLGLIIKWYVWNDAKQYFSQNKVHVDRMMVTPMPFTCVYWYVLAENKNEFIVAHRSILSVGITESPIHINRGPLRLDGLKWKGNNETKNLYRVTNDYCILQEEGTTLVAYDLRFGLLSKITRDRINTPLMGYEFTVRNGEIVKTEMHRNVQWDKVDFTYYWGKVIGK